MNDLFKKYVETRLDEIIESELHNNTRKHDIFVLQGLSDIADVSKYSDNLVDRETFNVDGNEAVFDQVDWFFRMQMGLRQAKEFYLMSYQQFAYFTNYGSNLTAFIERMVVIHDNVRSLFPINEKDYIERAGADNLEQRPESMPIYQSEQVSIEGETFCSYLEPVRCEMVGFFNKPIAVEISLGRCDDILEIDDHMYSLDVFLNQAIHGRVRNYNLGVKLVKDVIRVDDFEKRLELANGVISLLGAGSLVLVKEQSLVEGYKPREETVQLLKEYWGENASFRNIMVYKNPGEGNVLIEISQGQIVDLIIDEYRRSRDNDVVPDDVFITAPTGSGKSLLFQLPAFYVSAHGDVTIVVSPLIALMKDQVSAIVQDRKFKKVAYLNSDLNLIDRDRIIDQCKNGEIDILYMSPELLLSYDISYFIGTRDLGLMVIDEAHLITTWGRDFRVDYWHLGSHINKIRKYKEMNFPLVALTATAIYSGPNDMVVDSMSSLYMHNPHLFLGQIKREEIRFVINNYDAFRGGYKRNKINQTVDFIKEISEHDIKTVVYVPYARHVSEIIEHVKEVAVPYYGALDAENRDFAYNQFRSNQMKVMVCTKAFGMGVDIPDIQVVYHHAPSGLLPDYVQEVGRVARTSGMNGFAALNYHEKDKQYSEQLFGMSSIRQWQITEILKKIYSIFIMGGKKRNLLISSDDFSYIFRDGDPEGAKLKTALMMIEKDYLTRARYNVLIARPKSLFVKCYARTNDYGLSVLARRYHDNYKELRKLGADQTVVMLDLDAIWQKDFNSMSFGAFKRMFYEGKLLRGDKAEIVPLSRYTLSLSQDFEIVKKRFFLLLDTMEKVFESYGGRVFSDSDFVSKLQVHYSDKKFCEQLARYALSAFSGKMTGPATIEENAFLQRREYESVSYKVFNLSYRTIFSNMKKYIMKMFEGTDQKTVSRFFSNENDNAITYSRMGSLIELIGMGTFECRGGDSPMIFVRINDPGRIYRDSENPYFKNELLTRTMKRHKISSEIFDHFFTNSFSSDERWNYIEDFFLGATNEELFEKYNPDEERNHVDIVKYIADNVEYVKHVNTDPSGGCTGGVFPARDGEQYFKGNLLTIEGRTMNVEQWICKDPVSFDKVRRKHKLDLAGRELFSLLKSKLRTQDPLYYREMMGLKMPIDYKGYDKPIEASIPYSTDPVGFYKWWKKADNTDKVHMSKSELLKLIIKVDELDPKALVARHRALLTSK